MIITKIEPQKNDKRVNIYIDGKFTFGLMAEIQFKYGLREGMDIDEYFMEKVLLEEEQLKANNTALKFLSHKKRTNKEIIDKLIDKGFEDNIIENTIDYLKGYGLIDDLDYAYSFVKDKIYLNQQGPNRIKYDLYRKGIPKKSLKRYLVKMMNIRALELAKKNIFLQR